MDLSKELDVDEFVQGLNYFGNWFCTIYKNVMAAEAEKKHFGEWMQEFSEIMGSRISQ